MIKITEYKKIGNNYQHLWLNKRLEKIKGNMFLLVYYTPKYKRTLSSKIVKLEVLND